jgi:hypothetical protein
LKDQIFSETNRWSLTYDYLYFGSYPKSLEDNETILSELRNITQTNEKGYIVYQGREYKEVVGKPNETGFYFNNGEKILRGETYYFRVELIKWRILFSDNNEMILITEDTIEHGLYNTVNYANSKLREFLNGDFYKFTFEDFEKEYINTTAFPASGYTSAFSDKVYVLSKEEFRKTEYGFVSAVSSNTRSSLTTDYSRTVGVFAEPNTSSLYAKCSWYWTRTAFSSSEICFVAGDGYLNDGQYGAASIGSEYDFGLGYRPVIRLKKA